MSHLNRLSPTAPPEPEPKTLLEELDTSLSHCQDRRRYYGLLNTNWYEQELELSYQRIQKEFLRIYTLKRHRQISSEMVLQESAHEYQIKAAQAAERSRLATETQNRLAEQRRKLGIVKQAAARQPSPGALAKAQAEELLRKAGIDPSQVLALMAR